MDSGDAEGQSSKRQRLHEAQMMPSLGPRMYGFPNTIITKLRYCDVVTVSGSAGAIGSQIYAANGIYDPDITGVGHQPMWRDTYAAIYNNYVVLGSKITVTATAVQANIPTIFVLQGDDETTAGTIITRMEMNNAVSVMLGTRESGDAVNTLTATFEPQEAYGVDAKSDGASQIAVGLNPTQLWNYNISLQSCDASTTVNWYLKVEIDYTVKFSELQTNSGS